MISEKRQFQVLYRQFLFRLVDLELLSTHAQGDASRLLGQFAALLVFLSVCFCLPLLGVGNRTGQALLMERWAAEHFLIATTMLVVGIFAVLSWNSLFPDKREVMTLMPLPVRSRTMLAARAASLATALAITVGCINAFTGLLWPPALSRAHDAIRMPVFSLDDRLPPLTAESLKPVLDHDLAEALAPFGRLRPNAQIGLAVGISVNGERRIYTYGAARADSLFEIGSVTKTFTALTLARMAADGRVRLDQPVRELLPPGLVSRPRHSEILLVDLATHHATLPRMAPDYRPKDPGNPFADFTEDDLHSYLKRRGVWREPKPRMRYSNLGYGLLGSVLAARAGRTYEQLIRETITQPLGLQDTIITLSADQQQRFLQGYDIEERPVQAFTMDAIAGAGALRSTIGDMLRYAEAHLHPERTSLAHAIEGAIQPRVRVGGDASIGLAWLHDRDSSTWWHNGATAGFTADISFHRERGYALAVLSSAGPATAVSADLVAQHIRSRLHGEPPAALREIVAPRAGGALHMLRTLLTYWVVMFAAGAFVFGLVLSVQGLAAFLPRPVFLRLSPVLQIGLFCLFILTYFLQPAVGGAGPMRAAWLPSYWFLGLFQQLSGSPVLGQLALRAWLGLGLVMATGAGTYLLCYRRTLRRIVESPDSAPLRASGSWLLPRFRVPLQTALVQFSIRTLMRSRMHRLLMAFYVGIGLGLTVFFLRTPASQRFEEATSEITASLLMMGFAIVGVNVAFGLPVDLGANWIFQMTPVQADRTLFSARRRALAFLGLLPSVALCGWWMAGRWPWIELAGHLLILALAGLVLIEYFVQRRTAIPFGCAYLPGRSQVNITVLLSIVAIIAVAAEVSEYERRALQSPKMLTLLVGALLGLLLLLRRRTRAIAREASGIEFEPELPTETIALRLDGIPSERTPVKSQA